jgi:hypothetical protein
MYYWSIGSHPIEEFQMTNTFFAVVDAAGEFKKHGRMDTGEYSTQREAEAFRQSLSNPDDYTVQSFTEEMDAE